MSFDTELVSNPTSPVMRRAWAWARKHWPELLLPPAALLLAAGITRQALRVYAGPDSGGWRKHYQAAFQEGVKGDRERSFRELALAAKMAPGTPQAHMDLAMGWEKLGERTRAYSHLERALRLQPVSEEAREATLGLVAAYADLGQFDDARRLLMDRVLPLWPKSAAAHYQLGMVRLYGEKGDAGVRRASESFQESLRLDSAYTSARHQYGVCLTRLGRFSDAESEFRTVLEADPVHEPACHALAESLRRQGKLVEAEKVLERFRDLDARHRRSRYLETQISLKRHRAGQLLELGSLYLSLHRFDQALIAIGRYTRESPTDPEGHRRLAQALRGLKRPLEARASDELARALERRGGK